MKRIFDRIASYLTQSPTRFFFIAAIAAFFVLWFVNAYSDPDGFNWHDVIVESHGVLFDLLVFGILLSVYEALREKKDKIERLHEEIDDYRGWSEREATYRIAGSIKRLNKENIHKMDLSGCFLYALQLHGINVENSDINGTDLCNTRLYDIIAKGANFEGAYLHKSLIIGSNFEKALLWRSEFDNGVIFRTSFKESDLQGVSFKGANIKETDFSTANLLGANFESAILEDVIFKHAHVDHNWFIQLETWQVKGREAIIERYYIDEDNRLQLRNPLTP